jgi:2-polyprenyl-6-methoxyphenol hydroxylase-like FAD-dependent oxidoreductase
MTDTVVIAGAGPAGLMLACELGLAGVPAVVLDRDPTPAGERFSPGTTLHARSIELFERHGLMDAVRAEETVVWPRVHFSNIWVDLTPVIDHEYSIILPQARTERILADRALALGADIRRGHAVVGLEQDGDGVTVRVRAADGDYDLRARYLVGCDGTESTVRALVGIEAPHSGPSWYGIMADFAADEDDEWEFDSPDFPNGVFVITPHPESWEQLRLMTVEFDMDPEADLGIAADAPTTREEVSASIRRITGTDGTPPGELRWAQRFTDRTRLAARYREGNVFLAGDAAHSHYYGAGHGLNTSLHDAANLGWKLAADIQGWAPAGLLDTYASERHPVGRRACLASEASLVLAHPLQRLAPLREVFTELMGYENVERHIITMVTGVAYAMPPKGVPGDGPSLLGRPLPAATLTTADGGIGTYAALRSGRGVLFDFSDGTQDVECVKRWADHVDVVTARPVAEIPATALLVRPDGFVAWEDATGRDTEGLAAALTAWFGAGTD